ncbi:hypothetical protein HAX54_042125 [Datura stramonium]|uniref:Cystatin domain-containing protein n=1 Tax=Datura stramonium TaxID=4076 RepID=A0ABS8SLN2_DATST|nr:hypothetical protein [Datura stramonium]
MPSTSRYTLSVCPRSKRNEFFEAMSALYAAENEEPLVELSTQQLVDHVSIVFDYANRGNKHDRRECYFGSHIDVFRYAMNVAIRRCDIAMAEGKRKLEEETVKQDYGEDYYSDSDEDIVTYAGGRKMSREHRQEYLRQLNESDGFDITLDLELGATLGGPIVPLRRRLNDPKIIELSHMAIDSFNSQNAQNYQFVKIVSVNASAAAGIWYYITFDAKDADADYALKTFQALVWEGIKGDREVNFCRLKKSSSNQGNEKSPDSSVGAQ